MTIPISTDVLNRRIANKIAFVSVSLLLLLTLLPGMALADDAKSKLTAKAKDVFDIIFELAYWGCGIVAVASILGWMASKVEGSTLLKVLAGSVLLFSVTLLLDYAKS